MNTFWKIFGISLFIVAGCAALLFWKQEDKTSGPGAGELVLYCAAGIKLPVAEAAARYERTYGVRVQLQYGGSGTLLSNLAIARTGDLYLAADRSYLDAARARGLVAESVPLAVLRPVIGVRRGNPKNIRSVEDLLDGGVRLALANPEAASIGRKTRKLLEQTGLWHQIEQAAVVYKPTVTEIANDIKLGAVDAGVIWDATANQYEEIEAVRVPLFDGAATEVVIGVLTSCRNPAAALRFCRYLGAPERGQRVFANWGFEPAPGGDRWSEHPEIVLFSGGVNRLAIKETVAEFSSREGVTVTTVYNGCGILVAQMKAGERPDAYFACDVSFMTEVADIFLDTEDISSTPMVIAVAWGNPLGIKSLDDLARPGLRLGVANTQQSALGALTAKLLKELGIYQAVMKNVNSRTPTADLLVNQLRTGSLDAVIVYQANLSRVRDLLGIVPIDHRSALAVQPIGVAAETGYPRLTSRLVRAIRSAQSEKRFRQAGFEWLVKAQ
ncbi:MAG: molybdate ABC transporter substrate-binding protein [Candidatus Glassbacteria bacterium]|nr:molybdate ABC transporter substrate-binding protein [Candidatus Glassbacteria bacterium]